MNVFEFANKIDGMDKDDDIPFDYEVEAQREGMVIMYAHDDVIHIRGAIFEDIEFKYGTEFDIWFSENGVIFNDEEFDMIIKKIKVGAKRGTYPAWDFSFSVDIEHSLFDTYDGMDLYCRGIIFSLNEIA